MHEITGGGKILCHKCHDAYFESYAMRDAHLTVCGGKIHVVSNGTEPERFRDLPLQTLRHKKNQAPQKDDAPPLPLHPDAA
jgi:hypothetical protein